jgi:hypothetical protein
MSNAFKILLEDSFDYKNKEYLSLMMIREYDAYSVEVISRTMSHGRIYVASKKEATELFDALNKKIKLIKSFKTTCDMLDVLKKTKSFNEALFILKVYGRKLNMDQIGRLISGFKLKVKSKFDKNDSMRINVFFSGESKRFGLLKGTFLKEDFVFEKT